VAAPVFYARPEAVGGTLEVAPAVASWDKAGSPGQARSAAFTAGVHAAIAEPLHATPDPLALRLDIALSDRQFLLALKDELGVHCVVDPDAGNRVGIEIRVRAAPDGMGGQ
jgi:hypothetical protein